MTDGSQGRCLPPLGPLHTEQLLWAQSCTDQKLIWLSCHSVHVLHLSKGHHEKPSQMSCRKPDTLHLLYFLRKRLIWSDYSWTHVSILRDFASFSNSRTFQTFTISSNILAKFYAKHTSTELETELFFGNQNWNSQCSDFKDHFHSYTESHSLIQEVFMDPFFSSSLL